MDNTRHRPSQVRQSTSFEPDGQRRIKLKEAFAAGWDEGWIRQALSRFLANHVVAQATFLGEGRHFKAWLAKRDGADPVVIRIANASFHGKLMARRQRWVELLRAAERHHTALLPPFRVIWDEEELALVTPYFPEVIPASAHAMHQELLTKLAEDLSHLKLVLDDYWQLRALDGLVYVVDWSDLAARGPI